MRVADMVAQPAAFRYLQPLGRFRSMLGIPVRQSDASARLGILLFHQAADYFSELHLDDARISAGFLGIQIERQQLLRMSLSAQQTILARRLSLVMAHEVQKQLGTIGAHVETLNVRLHISCGGKMKRSATRICSILGCPIAERGCKSRSRAFREFSAASSISRARTPSSPSI